MTQEELIRNRHSVRRFIDKELKKEDIDALNALINEINKEAGLHFQLIVNEKEAFDSFLAHYGKFQNVSNYIACIGKKKQRFR